MRNNNYRVLLFILVVVAAACTTAPITTPTLIPTQTPFVLVVTATPSFTPVPSLTPVPTQTSAPTLTPSVQPTASVLDRCMLRTDWYHYQIQVGDTLSSLAVRTHSTVTTLQLANCVTDVNRIQVGQTLYVPQRPEASEPIVEDLISDFSVNITEATAGDTVIFSWEAESGTVIEIRHVTGNNIFIGSNLAASGSLSYTLPANLGNLKKLEFVIRGTKPDEDGDILASPYSVFINIVEEATATNTPTTTATSTATDEPESTDDADTTEEPEATEESS